MSFTTGLLSSSALEAFQFSDSPLAWSTESDAFLSTIYWSMVYGYEEIYGPLDEDLADRVYGEFSVMATGLRVPPDMWPKDRKEFQIYWNRAIDILHRALVPVCRISSCSTSSSPCANK